VTEEPADPRIAAVETVGITPIPGALSLVEKPGVNERIAVWDAITRNALALSIMLLFCVVNVFTVCFLLHVYTVDQQDLAAKLIGPADRIVNSEVLVSLLGATTAQLAAIAVIMAKYVFKAPVDGG